MVNIPFHPLAVFNQCALTGNAFIQAIGNTVKFLSADLIHKANRHNAALEDTTKNITTILNQPVIDRQLSGLRINSGCGLEKHAAKVKTFFLIIKEIVSTTEPCEKWNTLLSTG